MSAGGIDPALLAILACPATRTPLRHDPARNELISDAAGLAYPIRDGVPVLLVEAARVINASDRPRSASDLQTKL